jgi:hypothetical protein
MDCGRKKGSEGFYDSERSERLMAFEGLERGNTQRSIVCVFYRSWIICNS